MSYGVQKYENLFAAISRIANTRGMKAIQRGTYVGIFFLVSGTIALFFVFPDPDWKNTLIWSFRSSLTIMGLAISFAIAFFYLEKGKGRVLAGCVALASFMLTLPMPASPADFLPMMLDLSTSSILVGILIGLITGKAAYMAFSWAEKTSNFLSRFFLRYLLLPAIFIPASWLMGAFGFKIHPLVGAIVRHMIFLGDSLPAALTVIFMICLLWYAGVHGPAVVGSIVTPIYLVTLSENLQAIQQNLPPPHTVTTIFFTMVFIGGGGCTLPLCVLMLRSKIRRIRYMARAALLPGIFNVNEFLIFGIPIVMNPYFFIPFITAPLLCGLFTYSITYFRWAQPAHIFCPGFFPGPIAAFVGTQGNWGALLLTVLNFFISYIIYRPFFEAFQKKIFEELSTEDSPAHKTDEALIAERQIK
ncbi:MAG: PTS transporter subunit EIIC [Syntrophales bacterium]|nr:PTS transporter subunit EIIC [Syntrophales bacterium]